MHLHDYETTFIFKSDLDESEHNRIKDRLANAIAENGGEVMVFEDWGRRRLAYKIKKATHGHYLFFNHMSPAGVPAEIERIVKVEDSIVRFLTIVNDRLVEPEENRLLAGQRAKTRIARARAGVVPDASGRRARGPRESAVTPVPVSAPSGSAVQATPEDEAVETAPVEAAPAEQADETDQD